MSSIVDKGKQIVEEILEVYPKKAKKDRTKHFEIADEELVNCGTCSIKSNMKSRPGVMTARGCAYAGSRVWYGARLKTWCTLAMVPSAAGNTVST